MAKKVAVLAVNPVKWIWFVPIFGIIFREWHYL